MAKSKEQVEIEIAIAKEKAEQSLKKLLADIEKLGDKPVEVNVKEKIASAVGIGKWGVDEYIQNLKDQIHEALKPTSSETGNYARTGLEVRAGSGKLDRLAQTLSELTGAESPSESFEKALKNYRANSEKVEKKLLEDERKKDKKEKDESRRKDKTEIHDKENKTLDEIKAEVKRGFGESVRLAYQQRGIDFERSAALSPAANNVLTGVAAAAVAFRDIGEKSAESFAEARNAIADGFNTAVAEPVKKAGEYVKGAVSKVTTPVINGVKSALDMFQTAHEYNKDVSNKQVVAIGEAFKNIGTMLWRGKAPDEATETISSDEPVDEKTGYSLDDYFNDLLHTTEESIEDAADTISESVEKAASKKSRDRKSDDEEDEASTATAKKSRGWLGAIGAGAAGFGIGALKMLNPLAAFAGSGKKKIGYSFDDDDDDDELPSKARSQVKRGFNIFSDFLLADTRKWKDWFGDAFESIKKGIDKVSNMFAVKLITAPSRLLISGATKVAGKIGNIIGGAVDSIKSIASDIMGGVFLGMGINMTASPGGILNSIFDAGSRRLERAKESREGRREIELQIDKLQKQQSVLFGDGRMSFEAMKQMQEYQSQLDDLSHQYRDVAESEKEGELALANLSSGWTAISDTVGRFVLEAQQYLMPLFESMQGYIADSLPSALAFITACVKNPTDAFALLCDAGKYAIEALKNILLYFFTDYMPKSITSLLEYIWDAFTTFNWGGIIKSWVAYFAQGFFEIQVLGLQLFNGLLSAAGKLGTSIWNAITGKGFDFSGLGDAFLEGFNEADKFESVQKTRKKLEEARAEGAFAEGNPTLNMPTWERNEGDEERRLREQMGDSLAVITGSGAYKEAKETWGGVLKEFQTFNKENLEGKNRELNKNDIAQLRQDNSQQASFESAASSWSRIASSISNKVSPEVMAINSLKDETRKDSERQRAVEERAANARNKTNDLLTKIASNTVSGSVFG